MQNNDFTESYILALGLNEQNKPKEKYINFNNIEIIKEEKENDFDKKEINRKKIKQFKKMLTRNSKVFTKKYGKEIIEPNRNYGSCDGGEKNKFDNNSSNSINIKLFKKKKTEIIIVVI